MVDAFSAVFQRPNFLTFVIIFLWGFYIMVTRYNLVKKLIGMYLVQTSVIFFLVTISVKKGATIPVLLSTTEPVQAASYANPLPHVLTLTAIVVGVATLGVGLALCGAIYRKYGSLTNKKFLKNWNEPPTSRNPIPAPIVCRYFPASGLSKTPSLEPAHFCGNSRGDGAGLYFKSL